MLIGTPKWQKRGGFVPNKEAVTLSVLHARIRPQPIEDTSVQETCSPEFGPVEASDKRFSGAGLYARWGNIRRPNIDDTALI